MPVYATAATMEQLHDTFRYAFDEPQPWKNYLRLDPRIISGAFDLGETRIVPVELPHGKVKTTGFVFHRGGRKLLAYFTDCATVPEEALEAARGTEVLILDALRDTPHPMHQTVEQALELVRELKPKRAWFTHIAHDLPHAETNQRLIDAGYANVALAYDGLHFEVAL